MKLFILLINIDILISGMLWKGKIIGRNENEVFFLRGILNQWEKSKQYITSLIENRLSQKNIYLFIKW